jgi:hypothetical protein
VPRRRSPDARRLVAFWAHHQLSLFSGRRSPLAPGVCLASGSAFHEQIAALPDNEREVFELVWYQDSPKPRPPSCGVDVRKIKRRWLSAWMTLQDALQGEVPE